MKKLLILCIVAIVLIPSVIQSSGLRELELRDQLHKCEVALSKQTNILEKLIGRELSDTWLHLPTKITWYSLSADETDSDPDTAAHGKSKPFMAAFSKYAVNALNLSPGDKVLIVSDDQEIAVVVEYWDHKNARYDSESWVDIVAPSKEVAKRGGIRPGKIIKL